MKKIISIAAAIMLLPLAACFSQAEEPEIVWEQYVGESISEAQFSVDGSMIAYRNPDNGKVSIRDAADGELINEIYSANGNVILRFDFFPDSKRIAVASYYKGPIVYSVDIESGNVLDSITYDTGRELQEMSRAGNVILSPDGRYLAFSVHIPKIVPESLGIDQVVIWDTEKEEVNKMFSAGEGETVGVVDFSEDGRYLVAFLPSQLDDKHLKVLSVPDWNVVNSFYQSSYAWDISISPDGSMLAAAGGSGYIRIWDIESGEMIFKERHSGGASTALFSNDSKYILGFGGNFPNDFSLKFWDIQTKEIVKIYQDYRGSWAISPLNGYLLFDSDPNLTLFKEDWDFTSIPIEKSTEQTTLFPNPTDNKVNIEFNLSEFSMVDIKIIDVEGKIIENLFSGELNLGEHNFYWDSSEYAPGTYYCRIETDNYVKTYKIIVNK